jgi:septal ring factor EnvC (AmiA/AmiB activator)
MKLTITTILLFVVTASAQASDSLAIRQLQQSVQQLQKELRVQKKEFSTTNKTIAGLQSEITSQQQTIAAISDSLGIRIADTQTVATQQIQEVRQTVSANTLYWIIAVLAIALLSAGLFFALRKRLSKDKTDLVAQLSQTKASIEESLVKEFGRQTELMDTQLAVIRQQKDSPQTSTDPDHSLALKVASEINLIERNIKLMDAGTKGIKQLSRSVEKLKDNLAANGYEMPQLLGKQFHEGMKVIVSSSLPDESLETGAEIISKILIPQVNYNGVMIQTAQIEVSVGV